MVLSLALLFACILAAAECAPCPVELNTAGSGDQPTASPTLASCAQETPGPKSTACNATEEFQTAVGSLGQGLRLLKSYSKKLRCYFNDQSDQCNQNRLIVAYLLADDKANMVENFISILHGYSQLADQALLDLGEDQLEALALMQGVVDIISAVLTDYKKVLAPEKCTCEPEDSCTNIFTPLANLNLGSACRPHLYVSDFLFEEVSDFLEYLYGQEGRVKMVWSKKGSEETVGITPQAQTDNQWIASHLNNASTIVREYL